MSYAPAYDELYANAVRRSEIGTVCIMVYSSLAKAKLDGFRLAGTCYETDTEVESSILKNYLGSSSPVGKRRMYAVLRAAGFYSILVKEVEAEADA